MKALYVFPHPDDESFGPAIAISAQTRAGHEAHLLTLTRGGATKERHRLGLTVEEMGAARRGEMDCVAGALGLASMTVLDFPDSGLKDLDPRELERAVAGRVEAVRPDVLVSYALRGVSGFADHLVAHAVVKRVFCETRGTPGGPRRLAMFTVDGDQAGAAGVHALQPSAAEEIGCVVRGEVEDLRALNRALDCYVTYQQPIAATNVRTLDHACFELFQEKFDPPLGDMFEGL